MYTINDLTKELGVSPKTIRRWIKRLGIVPADKDGRKQLFSDKELTTLHDAINTKHRKHTSVLTAGMANIQKADTEPGQSVQIQELLEELDKTGRTLASEEYLTSVADRVADQLKHDENVDKVISLLTTAINRAEVLDSHHDDLVGQIQSLSGKVDNLYNKLVHNMKQFDYRKMAKINADEILKRTRVEGQGPSQAYGGHETPDKVVPD
jgi:DNA-binding transcriptional MerR regulator